LYIQVVKNIVIGAKERGPVPASERKWTKNNFHFDWLGQDSILHHLFLGTMILYPEYVIKRIPKPTHFNSEGGGSMVPETILHRARTYKTTVLISVVEKKAPFILGS
jgi:hypothetical protein